jgi:hypothetical protein
MANLLFVQTSGGHDVLWFQERLGGSATNSDSSDCDHSVTSADVRLSVGLKTKRQRFETVNFHTSRRLSNYSNACPCSLR